MTRRLPLGPTVLTALMLPVLLALALWQLDRADWKDNLLDRLAAAPQLPPVELPRDWSPDLDFRRAVVDCSVEKAAPAVRAGRSTTGIAGYSYFVPCRMSGIDRRLTLDAGWSARPDTVATITATGPFRGLLRATGGAYILVSADAVAPLIPSAPPSVDEIPNNHLSYAMQWFFFAATLLVIYLVYLTQWRRERARRNTSIAADAAER